MAKILFDARLYGLKNAGIGRYIMKLLENLQCDSQNNYSILLRKSDFNQIKFGKNFQKVLADFPHYTLSEQRFLPALIAEIKPDFCHFPHFNTPIFYRGKYVVTIHDLIKHFSKGSKTTTKTPFLYWPKFIAYKTVFRRGVRNATKIIVPSFSVKNELEGVYPKTKGKIEVVYEGVDEKFKKKTRQESNLLAKYQIKRPFVIYTGSVYPHKNIESLLQAIKLINGTNNSQKANQKIMLVISCARSVFWERLSGQIEKQKLGGLVKMAGFIKDEELAFLYGQASCFVFPTLSEGFGLPGLEAMAAGLPVVCSNIPVLKEVYNGAALYFNPKDPKEIAQKILSIINDDFLAASLRKKGFAQIKKYSWQKTAEETLRVYEEIKVSPAS